MRILRVFFVRVRALPVFFLTDSVFIEVSLYNFLLMSESELKTIASISMNANWATMFDTRVDQCQCHIGTVSQTSASVSCCVGRKRY